MNNSYNFLCSLNINDYNFLIIKEQKNQSHSGTAIIYIFKALAHSSGYDSTDEELGDGGETHIHKNRQRLRAARSEEFLDRANDDRRGGR